MDHKADDLIKQDLEDSFLITKYAFGRASNYLHRGNWRFTGKNGIKEWLVDGGHKMHKIIYQN